MRDPTFWNEAILEKVRGVCLDVDDTLSTAGKLTAEAYAALWALHEAGFVLVPVTGRPAGWCDHIARFWPVDAVVGENGAFVIMADSQRRLHQLETPARRPDKWASVAPDASIAAMQSLIQAKFPKARWASDQPYRKYDLAVDYCEDVEPWSQEEVNSVLKFARDHEINVKVSSIHLNLWIGDYDKETGFRNYLKLARSDLGLSEWVYVGDSPNDEPMFRMFAQSVGVANLKPYLNALDTAPQWITQRPSGAGFVEVAERLLSLQPA